MNSGGKSTAGPRQFEQTAVAKLQARGVPKHVAEAFVKIGIPKTGRVQEIKDRVCKMEYVPFFVPRTLKDFADPLRVGAYVPYVHETHNSKFHCEFLMSDLEAARFVKCFPEYDVVAKGKVFNQHGFYANKRYAEAELLVDMVFRDANRSGLDPRSLVDMGGNDTWHAKRGRDYVHCDNPVLSARDVMRYKVRQIFSGSDRSRVCHKTFHQCEVSADYAIAVHSTYDMSPKAIATGMLKRGIKVFYGVINVIPGIEDKPPGMYESDGITMEVVKDYRNPSYVVCGFKHDPSLKYNHQLRVLRKYLLVNKHYSLVDSTGSSVSFVYSIVSVRGNSLVFSVERKVPSLLLSEQPWSTPPRRSYFISLRHLGVDGLEVDSELFDRLVLQAASARNQKEYDILSLYKYGKSLRQRVSINGVVLSSGYLHNPEELTYAVIAAFATAQAFRIESADYFRRATSQIMSRRSQGFLLDVLTITTKALVEIVLALPKALAYISGLAALDAAISRLIAEGRSVEISIHKPHMTKGMVYNPLLLTRRTTVNYIRDCVQKGVSPSPLSEFYSTTLVPVKVNLEQKDVVLLSRGLVAYDAQELPKPINTLFTIDLVSFKKTSSVNWVEDARRMYYEQAMGNLFGPAGTFVQPAVMANGDRVIRLATTLYPGLREMGRDDISFVGNNQKFVVFRGVGKYAVKLTPPDMYARDNCVGFYLFYEGKLDSIASRHTVESAPSVQGDSFTAVSEPPPDDYYQAKLVKDVNVTVTDHGWNDFGVDDSSIDIRRFGSNEESTEFFDTSLAAGEFFLSGALPDSAPHTPPADDGEGFIRDYVTKGVDIPTIDVTDADVVVDSNAVLSASVDASVGSVDSPDLTVTSSEVVPGRNSIEEMVAVCDESKAVALATSKLLIDMASAAARGELVYSRFRAVAQGHPGNVRLVSVLDDGRFVDKTTGELLEHMAVSDGEEVYDRIDIPPKPGVYVTSDVMLIYTGAGIRRSVQSVVDEPYMCSVTCVDGVAGSGKSYHILNNAKVGDVVLCETRASLDDLAEGLKRIPGWLGAAYSIDSFLLHRQVMSADTLWVDEAFRLHAGKMYAIIKLIKPKRVVCFGDSKQIPALPYLPGFEFKYHEFPYEHISVKRDTWRSPADVCFCMSYPSYYGAHVTTHNPIMRSLKGPVHFETGMFHGKPPDVCLLVYEKDLAHDLRKSGVQNVLTIGQSQGKTFDHVMLYRSNGNNKAIYYDKFQTLVALTRHRKSFLYVTVCAVDVDNSAAATCLRYLKSKGTEVLLSSHYCAGVRPAADYATLDNRVGDAASTSGGSSSDPDYDVVSRTGNWAEMMDEESE